LYAVAAVGYYLLTGTPPFSGTSPIEVCMHHVKTPPERPADRVGQPLAEDLQAVLLRGLAKQPQDRFASALEFAEALAACDAAGAWTSRQAAAWWAGQTSGIAVTQPLAASPAKPTEPVHQLPTMELVK
jgi:serine/threonine-protein kinase